jgi:hypothetical protein
VVSLLEVLRPKMCVCISVICPMRAGCLPHNPTHPSLFDYPNNIWGLREAPDSAVFFSLLLLPLPEVQILVSALVSRTVSIHVLLSNNRQFRV